MEEGWLEKLAREYKEKQLRNLSERQAQQSHDEFISGHGLAAWRDLMMQTDEARKFINNTQGHETFRFSRGEDSFRLETSVGSLVTLDVSLNLPTRTVEWECIDAGRGNSSTGKLLPDRAGNAFIYREDDQNKMSIKDAAAFLVRKVFP